MNNLIVPPKILRDQLREGFLCSEKNLDVFDMDGMQLILTKSTHFHIFLRFAPPTSSFNDFKKIFRDVYEQILSNSEFFSGEFSIDLCYFNANVISFANDQIQDRDGVLNLIESRLKYLEKKSYTKR